MKKLTQKSLPESARPVWPLDAPGLSAPGPALLALAAARGSEYALAGKRGSAGLARYDEVLADIVRDALYQAGKVAVNIRLGSTHSTRVVVSGHRWGSGIVRRNGVVGTLPADGPCPCRVLVIGKMVSETGAEDLRHFSDDAGRLLVETLRKYDYTGEADWYVTSALKIADPGESSSSLKAAWISEFDHLFQQELRLVKPDFILCVGSDALKAVLGKKATLEKARGVVQTLTVDMRRKASEPLRNHVVQVMACEHPNSVMRDDRKRPRFELDVARFIKLLSGAEPNAAEEGLDHRIIRDERELIAVIRHAEANNPSRIVAVDAEWHGQHPQNEGAYLRCMQFSWAHKAAACVALHAPGGEPSFKILVRDKNNKPLVKNGRPVWTTADGMQRAFQLLTKYFVNKRVVGHFLNADLEWLVHFGLDLREQFAAPADWTKCRTVGGWDTGSMAHATEETGIFNLTDQSLRHTTAPRYDVALDAWKAEFCRSRGLKASQLEGYGECPEEVLEPYACLHGDSLVQLADGSWRQIRELVSDRYAGCVRSLVDGVVVNSRVTNWHKSDARQRDWFRLRTVGSQYGRHGLLGPLLTPDHKVLTQRGKVRVDALRQGRDAIATEELTFSGQQLSVFLGSLLGDGGYCRKNAGQVGFGFGQVAHRAAYADWKAGVFAAQGPSLRDTGGASQRYELPFSRYLTWLSSQFPAHLPSEHGKCKGVITERLLSGLGNLGLAVWYQDDGTLVRDGRNRRYLSSRIYARLPASEQSLVVAWLSRRFGAGIRYNQKSRFIQIGGTAFVRFHRAIQAYMHPVMAYKTPLNVAVVPPIVTPGTQLFYAPIEEVVRWNYSGPRRGNGVRYCLTVARAGNFLTKAGFVSNCYDADVTRRIALRYAKKLDCDEFGNNCWEAFWITQRASPAALEITRTGLQINRERLDRLTTVYMQARDNLARKIRTWARWPELKLNSAHHIRELLYGEQFNEPDADGRVRRHRPRGALSLYAMPTITTGKRPRPWEAVIGTPAEKTSTPSTNKSALGILFRESDKMRVWSPRRKTWQVKDCGKYIEDIRNYRFVNQTLQSVLAKPMEAEDAEDFDDPFEVDEDGNFVYAARLPGSICTDNRVRTFISQLKETGRWSSSRPPLMNLGAKRRELDYKQILGESYEYPLRSIFEADEGFTLVESDYIGAELFGMAILSGDTTMIDHALRNQLPEDHPDYFDIHSSMASLAFQLDCAPTKAALQALGKSHLRAVAKAILFGLAYGRGAKAVALAVREEGIHISVDEAQQVIDTIFATYPLLVPFFAECRARVVCRDRRLGPAPRWLCGALGRFRRFPYTTDRELMADFERQAMNFPLQNMVADAVSRAADHLLTVRRRRRLGFKFALQIHDALLFLVPNHEVPVFIDEVLPLCMTKLVPIYPCHLDGRPKKGTKAYSLGIDTEVYRYWGVGMSPRDCQERSVPEKYAGWHKSELFPGGWESHKAPRSVWLARTGKSHPFITGQTKSMLKEDAYRQAIDLGRLPEPAEPVVKAMKSMKDAELVKLLGL